MAAGLNLQPQIFNGRLKLDLSNQGLTSIPPEVFDITDLEDLDVSNNKLTSIPEAIGRLRELGVLLVEHNMLETLPQAVCSLPKVRSLNVRYNKLSFLPPDVSNMQTLEALALDNNELREIQSAVCHLPRLLLFGVSNNKLSSLPINVEMMPSLQILLISDNELTEVPPGVCSLSKLEVLDVARNKISILPPGVAKLQKLKSLYLGDNVLTELPADVCSMPNLESLGVQNNSISCLPTDVKKMQKLTYLAISGNKLKELPLEVCSLLNLKSLQVGGNPIRHLPDEITHLTRLKELEVTSCMLDEFPKQVRQLRALENLLAGGNRLTVIPDEVSDLQHLQFLKVDKNLLQALPSTMSNLKKLREVHLLNNTFKKFPESLCNLPELEKVDIRNNQITRLPITLHRADNLKDLDVSGNPLTYPPQDICQQGTSAIMTFLKQEAEKDKKTLQVLNRLSLNVTQPQLKPIARSLGLDNEEIAAIKASAPDDLPEQAYQMLLKWKEKEVKADTLSVLEQHLRYLGFQDLADQLTLSCTPADFASKYHKNKEHKRRPSATDSGHESTNRKRQHGSLSRQGQVKKTKQASVPVEIEMGGPEMIALYEQACKVGTTQVFNIRLILSGKHGNGKSSLKNSLLHLEFHKDEESTDGIVITSCLMTGKEEWKITEGMKGSEFVHAAAMEMKKMKEDKKPEQRMDGDRPRESKQASFKPDLHQTAPSSKNHQTEPVASTSSQSSATSTSAGRAATQSEDYKRATQIFLSKDDMSNIIGSKDHPTISIWDYAGHDVYYSSHHVFYSHYAIYIVTLNLEKPLDTPLKPWPGSCAGALQLRTEGDVFDYHLESIRAHTGPNKRTLLSDDQQQDKGPPVIVVGTHKDQVEQEQIDELFSNLKEHLSGKAIDTHVYDRYFAIDNTKRDPEDQEMSHLRDFILKIAQQQNHMGRRIPIRWLELKSKLVEMEKQGRKYCSLQDVLKATDSSDLPEGVTPERNAVTILRFFHLCGDILFFNSPELRNLVVLDPQWFVDVQKTIITIPKFRDPEVKDKWRLLETTGMLEDSLIEHVWRRRQEELKYDLINHKDELLKMMEQFDLILQCSTSKDDETDTSTNTSSPQNPTYFVPSLLTAVKDRKKLYPKGVKCSKPIFAVFDDKFCPVGVYHRLVIASMRQHNKLRPLAYASCARFITNNPKQTFVITKKDHHLKVELLSSEKEESACFSHGPAVRKGLDEDLREIINKWIPGIRYKWCLQCCCDSHKEMEELDEDSFIPITSVHEWFMEGEVICETYSPATTTIEDIGLGHWFQKPPKDAAAGQRSRVPQQDQSESEQQKSTEECDISFVAWCIPIVVELKPPWRELGSNLGLSEADMERISQEHLDDTARCLAVLEEWQHLSGSDATVEGLKSALDTAGQRAIVERMNTSEQSMRRELRNLQDQVTGILRANFPNVDFVPDMNKRADEDRQEVNKKILREELFASSTDYSLNSVILDLIQERKKSVCRINWPGGYGTGFLLSKGMILTCYHVYERMVRTSEMFHDLGLFTATFFMSVGKECKVRFHAIMLKGYSEELDYAILKLAVDDEMESTLDSLPYLGRYIPTVEDDRKMVVVVGHPHGGDKMVDFCPIAGVAERYVIHVRFPNLVQFPEDSRKPLYHTGVMFYGSSGSPGFDTHGNVVLMHTRGFLDANSKSIIECGVRLTAIRDHARQTLQSEVFDEIFPMS